MSVKHDFQIKKWQCLIKEYQESGMKLKDWCAANSITRDQYYYWLNRVRIEYYETAVKQFQTTETRSNAAVPVQLQTGSFIEIRAETASDISKQGNFNLPVAAVQKGSLRIEIMQNASASFIRQLLEAVHYA